MKYIVTFLIYIIPTGLLAQTAKKLNAEGFENKHIDRIEYSNKRTEFFISKQHRKILKRMYLKFRGNDSVSIYLNDSLVFSQWINNSGERYLESPFVISIPSNHKANAIIISLNKEKQYIEFKVKKKYYSIWAYYKQKANQWVIGQDNNLPME